MIHKHASMLHVHWMPCFFWGLLPKDNGYSNNPRIYDDLEKKISMQCLRFRRHYFEAQLTKCFLDIAYICESKENISSNCFEFGE